MKSAMPGRAPAAAAVLLAATLLAYWPVMQAGFVFDDEFLVIGNLCTTASDGIYRIWLTAENYEYLPLTYSGFWLEYRLWGQDALGYHLVSLGLHALNVILLWRLLGRLAIAGAWWGALLFAVHPVAVSSVAWISEQKNLWGLLFALTSLLLYLKFAASGRRGWYALSVTAFVVALLGKTSVAMLPFLLLCHRWRRAGRLQLADFAWTAPFFLASLVLGLVTIWFQVHRGMAGENILVGNYLERLYAAGYVVWFYVGKALAPTQLSMIYSQWDYARLGPLPTAALIALLFVLWRYRHQWRWGQACWLGFGAYVLILTPVLGFVPMAFMRFTLVADHFQYAALPALTALAGTLAAGAVEPCRSRMTPNLSRSIVAACCLVSIALAALTWRQAGAYKDSLTLWSAAIANEPNCSAAQYNLGVALSGRGQVDEAIAHYRKALDIKPDYADAHVNLGVALADREQFDEAIAHYRKALEFKPNHAKAHNNLGNALASTGNLGEAIAHYRKALEFRPDHAEAHNNLGNVLAGSRYIDEAIAHYWRALEIKPDYADAHYNLGRALAGRAQVDDAIAHYRKALEIEPDHVEAHNNLGLALARRGQVDEAITHFQKVLEIKPDLLEAHYNLGLALARRGRLNEALEHYQKALDLASARNERDLADRIRAKMKLAGKGN